MCVTEEGLQEQLLAMVHRFVSFVYIPFLVLFWFFICVFGKGCRSSCVVRVVSFSFSCCWPMTHLDYPQPQNPPPTPTPTEQVVDHEQPELQERATQLVRALGGYTIQLQELEDNLLARLAASQVRVYFKCVLDVLMGHHPPTHTPHLNQINA